MYNSSITFKSSNALSDVENLIIIKYFIFSTNGYVFYISRSLKLNSILWVKINVYFYNDKLKTNLSILSPPENLSLYLLVWIIVKIFVFLSLFELSLY